ncbi:MAG: galactokinase, partial [Gemmatimonadota bacterium]|nr:galactokinase [Gemmatimonadota bacterium]
VGARLTGAGFGGCVVALADRWTVGEVIETLAAEYYEGHDQAERLSERLFTAVPSRGASVHEV